MVYSSLIYPANCEPLLPPIDFESSLFKNSGGTDALDFVDSTGSSYASTQAPSGHDIGTNYDECENYWSFPSPQLLTEDDFVLKSLSLEPLDFSSVPTPETQFDTFNLDYENEVISAQDSPVFDVSDLNQQSLLTPQPELPSPEAAFAAEMQTAVISNFSNGEGCANDWLKELENEVLAFTVLRKRKERLSHYRVRTAYMEAIVMALRDWNLEPTTLVLCRIEKLRCFLNRGDREVHKVASRMGRLLFSRQGLNYHYTEKNRALFKSWPHQVRFVVPCKLRRWEKLILISWCLLNPELPLLELQNEYRHILSSPDLWDHVMRIRSMYVYEVPSSHSLRAMGDSVNQVSVLNRSIGSLSAESGNLTDWGLDSGTTGMNAGSEGLVFGGESGSANALSGFVGRIPTIASAFTVAGGGFTKYEHSFATS